jgi:hypothetical protein
MNDRFDGLLHCIKHYESFRGYHATAVTVGSGELNIFNPDGSPTLIKIEAVPLKLQNIVAPENAVFSCGSGFPNCNPGIDVFRYDKNDTLPYNRDHYSIYYKATDHPCMEKWMSIAGISATSSNLEILKGWKIIIKEPNDPKSHHLSYEAAFKIYEAITR